MKAKQDIQFTLRVTKTLRAWLDQRADEIGVSASDVARMILTEESKKLTMLLRDKPKAHDAVPATRPANAGNSVTPAETKCQYKQRKYETPGTPITLYGERKH